MTMSENTLIEYEFLKDNRLNITVLPTSNQFVADCPEIGNIKTHGCTRQEALDRMIGLIARRANRTFEKCLLKGLDDVETDLRLHPIS